MSCKKELLESLENVKNQFPDYYAELSSFINTCNDYENIDDFIKNLLPTEKHSFFTISSKEDFQCLESKNAWNGALVYTPLNDHSRCYMHKGDVVFCYRQGQFDSLDSALTIRGIYSIGFVLSEPKKLFPSATGHNQYGVCIIFPFAFPHHLELRNIQLNPITINLTPYNGNRNDALQYIESEEHVNELLKMICRKNPEIRSNLENILDKKIEDKKLPVEVWGEYKKGVSDSNYCRNFSQIIYYGVPGSGKSHKIDEKIKSISNAQKMRVVFHPDYSNADFVGQILPVMLDDGVEYRFKAGPFSRILKRALKNPSEPHYLIIEEINRGNAAAIFGDLFQLLDRKENGWSNYQIENLDLNAFIRSSGNTYSDKKIEPPTVKVGSDDWDENTGIRLPPNLSILATMNTSDQNVFTLDNAFQRRWDMQLVENKFGDTEEEENQRNAIIEGKNSKITWETFQTAINNKIGSASSEMGLSSLEDKRLGCWFVKAEKDNDGKFIIKKEVFANKVLKYLWDDAFKFSRDKIFENCSNFEELRSKFEQNGLNVFTQDLKSEFCKNKDSETSSE